MIARAGKSFGGGLPALRRALAAAGVADPVWCEVPKGKKAPKQVRRMVAEEGVELLFAWGGDGLVQRCVDTIAGDRLPVELAILPAGTSNLLAANLGIPTELERAVEIGLHGAGRALDAGRFNGERFAVMAGAGFDATLVKEADDLKDRLGRAAYVIGGARNLAAEPFGATIDVDGVRWYDGRATCVLLGNVGALFGGVEIFEDAAPDDGLLELGLLTAETRGEMVRAVARTAVGPAQRSPFVRVTKARTVAVALDRKVRCELDGGDRKKVTSFTVEVEPRALKVRVPRG
ncbi:diacylglycerol kinase family protein [Conexibacter sp. JD483]|uniref:diacylglycerol/lipid kinase family protein n=1 Tax=unclassified Conexibacter TaxID=2627773 RepID=UPI0027224138|nr:MULTISPECIES: diacylglycerol kinase family protein [unclassified Conexibacter]MDO8188606.1 diacylglycerol kinase family protein [Conexibacter sp. CPCC 205706]MDR9370863.1 diacylglycerol kinase family protein [Conexibacter sp. JD483]